MKHELLEKYGTWSDVPKDFTGTITTREGVVYYLRNKKLHNHANNQAIITNDYFLNPDRLNYYLNGLHETKENYHTIVNMTRRTRFLLV